MISLAASKAGQPDKACGVLTHAASGHACGVRACVAPSSAICCLLNMLPMQTLIAAGFVRKQLLRLSAPGAADLLSVRREDCILEDLSVQCSRGCCPRAGERPRSSVWGPFHGLVNLMTPHHQPYTNALCLISRVSVWHDAEDFGPKYHTCRRDRGAEVSCAVCRAPRCACSCTPAGYESCTGQR